jgi:hypothetical protein
MFRSKLRRKFYDKYNEKEREREGKMRIMLKGIMELCAVNNELIPSLHCSER